MVTKAGEERMVAVRDVYVAGICVEIVLERMLELTSR